MCLFVYDRNIYLAECISVTPRKLFCYSTDFLKRKHKRHVDVFIIFIKWALKHCLDVCK